MFVISNLPFVFRFVILRRPLPFVHFLTHDLLKGDQKGRHLFSVRNDGRTDKSRETVETSPVPV